MASQARDFWYAHSIGDGRHETERNHAQVEPFSRCVGSKPRTCLCFTPANNIAPRRQRGLREH